MAVEDQVADAMSGAPATRRVSPDLALVYVWLLVTLLAVYVPVVNTSPLRIALGLPMVLFIPGYALISALFPRSGDLDGIERVALSFGLSIAVVPLIGLALNFTPFGIRLDPILISLVAFTFVMALIGQYRRNHLSIDQRFSVPFAGIARQLRGDMMGPGVSRTDRVLSIVLIASIAVAIGTMAYVIAVPKEGEHFTEFYILGGGGNASGYPRVFPAGEPQGVIIGIGNHEYRDIPYTVETYLESWITDPATNESVLVAVEPLDRFVIEVPMNATEERFYRFFVPSSRYNRIEFVLYNETVPGEAVQGQDRINSAYRDLHLWIQVSDRV